ncbi:MAG TPA: encapsulin [Candidatus Sulfotelmatobacter sp.]|nr:encapsulin [Candidatus Sulfotelmatobacter sp.]
MNNLHRELAPISDSAWVQIGEETSRTLKRHVWGFRSRRMGLIFGDTLQKCRRGHKEQIY